MLVYNIRVSQGSVATRLRCGGNFTNGFFVNCPESVPVNELLKSVNIWRKYRQNFGGTFFMDHDAYMSKSKYTGA